MSPDFTEDVEKLTSTPGTGADRNTLAEVESELEFIFGDSGKQVLLVELSKRYDVTPRDAIGRPETFHTALYYLLGELGSKFVTERLNVRVSGSIHASPRVS